MEIQSKGIAQGLPGRAFRLAPVDRIRVWDPFVRVAHWLFVVLVVALVFSGFAGDQETHMALGIDLFILVLGRLVWGFTGDVHARFASFMTGPRRAISYLVSIGRGSPERYLGHNPAGGWMVVLLLLNLLVLAASGLVLQAELEYEGWFVGLLTLSDEAVSTVLAFHQKAVWTLLALIPMHLIGVLAASLQHKENLVAAMLTGYKREPQSLNAKEKY